jgi:Cu/Zn superoxide dismutase
LRQRSGLGYVGNSGPLHGPGDEYGFHGFDLFNCSSQGRTSAGPLLGAGAVVNNLQYSVHETLKQRSIHAADLANHANLQDVLST